MFTLVTHRPDHLERRWYQNQQKRQPGSGSGGGRLIRGGLGGVKHLSDMYDDDDMLRLQQDTNVAALLLDDVNLGGGYSSRNSVSAFIQMLLPMFIVMAVRITSICLLIGLPAN